MRKYHHLGIPTDTPRDNETYLKEYKVFVSGYETSPYGIEWMRFEPDSPLPELVKTVPLWPSKLMTSRLSLKARKC